MLNVFAFFRLAKLPALVALNPPALIPLIKLELVMLVEVVALVDLDEFVFTVVARDKELSRKRPLGKSY